MNVDMMVPLQSVHFVSVLFVWFRFNSVRFVSAR